MPSSKPFQIWKERKGASGELYCLKLEICGSIKSNPYPPDNDAYCGSFSPAFLIMQRDLAGQQ